MIATVVVSALTIVTNLILLIFKPSFTVKGKTISFYWIVALLGAIMLLAVGSITPSKTWAELTNNTAVHPQKTRTPNHLCSVYEIRPPRKHSGYACCSCLITPCNAICLMGLVQSYFYVQHNYSLEFLSCLL